MLKKLKALPRGHAWHRKEAIEAGAVPALCSVLGTGDDEPVSIEVLKALYTIIAPDSSGEVEDSRSAQHVLVGMLASHIIYM